MKKMSLRLRLTFISVFLLLFCCLGLTLILNYEAGNMADAIEAMPIIPAVTAGENAVPWQNGNTVKDGMQNANIMENKMLSQDTGIRRNTVLQHGGSAASAMPSESSRQARKLFLQQSYFYMMLIVAAGGFFTWFITGRALRPLGKLSREMQSRTVQNLSDRLPVPESNDEIASLTRSFNEMSSKLDEAFSMQKRFSQSAAHELRTPLTVLKAKIDVFAKKPIHTQEEYDALLQLMKTHTDRMSSLVNDLLNLTTLDDLSDCQTVDITFLLEEAVSELSTLADTKGVSLELDRVSCRNTGSKNTENAENTAHKSCGAVTIGVPGLLYRAFSNLIENAVKYNIPGGSVSVTVSERNGKIMIRIADTGLGIPDDQKAHIFEPFYRVDKSRSRQMGGAGLGLATVKAIIEKHSGEICVEDAPGGGSIFTVTLSAGNPSVEN